MSNFFKGAHNKIKNSPTIIVIWLVLVAALVISIGIAYEDYSTSLLGYQAIPTQKVNPWIVPLVALMPQVIQIVLFFNFLSDTSKIGNLIIAVVVHFIDVGLDVYYKSAGVSGIELTAIAWIESELIYTLGSEILLVMSFGMVFELFPDFIIQSKRVINSIMNALRDGKSGGKGFNYGDRGQGQSRSPNTPPVNHMDAEEMLARAEAAQMMREKMMQGGNPQQGVRVKGAVVNGNPSGVVVTKKPGLLDKFKK